MNGKSLEERDSEIFDSMFKSEQNFIDSGFVSTDGESRFMDILQRIATKRTSFETRVWVQCEKIEVGEKQAMVIKQWRTVNMRERPCQQRHLCSVKTTNMCNIECIVDNIYGCKNSGIVHICHCDVNRCRRVFINTSGMYVCVFSKKDICSSESNLRPDTASMKNQYLVGPNGRPIPQITLQKRTFIDKSPEAEAKRREFISVHMAKFKDMLKRLEHNRAAWLRHRKSDSINVLSHRIDTNTQTTHTRQGLASPASTVNKKIKGALSRFVKSKAVLVPEKAETFRTDPTLDAVPDEGEDERNIRDEDRTHIGRKVDPSRLLMLASNPGIVKSNMLIAPESGYTLASGVKMLPFTNDPATAFPVFVPRNPVPPLPSTCAASSKRARSPVLYNAESDSEHLESIAIGIVRLLSSEKLRKQIARNQMAELRLKTVNSVKKDRKVITMENLHDVLHHSVSTSREMLQRAKMISMVDVASCIDSWVNIIVGLLKMTVSLSKKYAPVIRTHSTEKGMFMLAMLYVLADGIEISGKVIVKRCPVLKSILPPSDVVCTIGGIKEMVSIRKYIADNSAKHINMVVKSFSDVVNWAKSSGASDEELSLFSYTRNNYADMAVTENWTVDDCNITHHRKDQVVHFLDSLGMERPVHKKRKT